MYVTLKALEQRLKTLGYSHIYDSDQKLLALTILMKAKASDSRTSLAEKANIASGVIVAKATKAYKPFALALKAATSTLFSNPREKARRNLKRVPLSFLTSREFTKILNMMRRSIR